MERRAWFGAAAALVVLDQLSKALIIGTFAAGESLPLLPPLLHLTYIQNTGAAFGLLKGQQALFMGLSMAVVGWVLWEMLRRPPRNRLVAWALCLVASGAFGNLIDRVRFGYVVDFIDLRVWPVFNVADSAISIGVALLVWQGVRPRPAPPA